MTTREQLKDSSQDPYTKMFQLVRGFWVSRAIYVAAELGIPDMLKEGPMTSEELARLSGTSAQSLRRILRALASVGVLAEDDSGRFTLTPLSGTLLSDSPRSIRAWTKLLLSGEHFAGWGELMHSVRTGETAFDHLFGMGIWRYYAEHPERARLFDEAMSNLVAVSYGDVLESYPFRDYEKIVDVGGGDGSFMVSILRANPGVKGVVFDLPEVVEKAKGQVAAGGLQERCEVVSGDMFTSVPSGGDAYILSRIIHDWDDDRSISILRNCHRAMREDGKLLILERVVPSKVEESPETASIMLIDLNMMVMTGGRERTEAEYDKILRAAGFRLTRVIPTRSVTSIVEVTRV